MKRLATATVVLTALATLAQADGLPKPIRLVDRIKMYDDTHSVHGRHSGSRVHRPVRQRPHPLRADDLQGCVQQHGTAIGHGRTLQRWSPAPGVLRTHGGAHARAGQGRGRFS